MSGIIVRMNEGNAAVDRGAAGLRDETGYTIVLESQLVGKNELLSHLGENDILIIHGHGSPRKLGGKTPNELAKLLADSGLRGPIRILLMACNGGITGAPFALELKVALVQGHKIMCSVSGAKGTLLRSRGTGDWSVKNTDGSKNPLGENNMYATTCSF